MEEHKKESPKTVETIDNDEWGTFENTLSFIPQEALFDEDELEDFYLYQSDYSAEDEEDTKKDAERSPEEILQKYWGFDSFRPKQKDIIASILEGKDTLGLLPTGGGKSITFQVPSLILPGITIVVSPLIALMKDQVENLKSRNIKAACIHSGLQKRQMHQILDNAVLGAYKLLYLSPERMLSPDFLHTLEHLKINMLVVDECHCISQWGYDFRPSYLNVIEFRKLHPQIPILALTASATPEVAEDIQKILGFSSPNIICKSFFRPNLSYVVRDSDDKIATILHILKSTKGAAIIYCRNRSRTGEIAKVLKNNKISADSFHAGLSHTERDERQERWMDNRTRVIVATNAFGMGIDKADVRIVIHWSIPSSLEEYFQEAGRAGRDEKKAYAVILRSKKDAQFIKRRIGDEFPPKPFIRDIYKKVNNYLKIGYGEGYLKSFIFNPEKFIQASKLPPLQTISAIRILDLSNVWNLREKEDLRSRLIFTIDRDELYSSSYAISPKEDAIILCILRSYPGIFTDYSFIDESKIARSIRASVDIVYEHLKDLTRKGVIHYIPKSADPKLFFKVRRESAQAIQIAPSIYEERKERLEKRIFGTLEYLLNTSTCRSQALVKYFGEDLQEECGICDICLEKKKSTIAKTNLELEEILDKYLQKKGDQIPLSRFLSSKEEPQTKAIIEQLRSIIDQRTDLSFEINSIIKIK